ncbi:MAG: transposase [Halobacteriovoraceae bacterium]|jgi:hypothetical protein|nr:transposase [Halobacteriovoraceae bacterium]
MTRDEFIELGTQFSEHRKNVSSRRYSKELKEKAKIALNGGFSIKEVSEITGVHETTLTKWRDGKVKKQVFSKAAIVADLPESSNITIITGLKIQDLSKVLSLIQ